MALTGRAALLALAGVVPVALAPGWATLLGWALLVLLLVAVDVALAGSPRALRLRRESSGAVRLGERPRPGWSWRTTAGGACAACCGTGGRRRRATPCRGTAIDVPAGRSAR